MRCARNIESVRLQMCLSLSGSLKRTLGVRERERESLIIGHKPPITETKCRCKTLILKSGSEWRWSPRGSPRAPVDSKGKGREWSGMADGGWGRDPGGKEGDGGGGVVCLFMKRWLGKRMNGSPLLEVNEQAIQPAPRGQPPLFSSLLSRSLSLSLSLFSVTPFFILPW